MTNKGLRMESLLVPSGYGFWVPLNCARKHGQYVAPFVWQPPGAARAGEEHHANENTPNREGFLGPTGRQCLGKNPSTLPIINALNNKQNKNQTMSQQHQSPWLCLHSKQPVEPYYGERTSLLAHNHNHTSRSGTAAIILPRGQKQKMTPPAALRFPSQQPLQMCLYGSD